MMSYEEIRKYATEEFSKMSYFEMLEAYINECFQHEITRNTLQLTIDKLETSRRALNRLKERSKNDNEN